MRRIGLIAAALAALLGISLLWSAFLQRRRAARQAAYAPASSPVWAATSPSAIATHGLAKMTESPHSHSDADDQPAAPPAPQIHTLSALPSDSELPSESSVATGTPSEGDSQPQAGPPDDLLRIEGIGPKVSTIVVAAGITTFAELASTDPARLQAILEEAGIHTTDPHTWPEQARLAADGKWDDLQELQDRIVNGQLEA